MSILDYFKREDIGIWVNKIRSMDKYVLIDVRNDYEFQAGHIGGARNIPVEKIKNTVNYVHNMDTPIFTYCETGQRSLKAVKALKKLGYTHVQNIGGIEDYTGMLKKGK